MRKSVAAGVASLVLGLSIALPAAASEPASHDVKLPTTPGKKVVIEWTGTALPGVTGQGTWGGIVDPMTWVPCPSPGPDDSHTVTLTVPEGIYDKGLEVNAEFHVEWERGEPLPGELMTDPDLVLSVYQDLLPYGSSDGGTPEENVGIQNPPAGTYTAVVCSFFSSAPTPYRGRLTLTALEPAACVADTGRVVPNGPGGSGRAIGNPESAALPNFDAFNTETAALARAIPTDLHGRLQPPVYDRALGLPTFLWARQDAPVAAVGALEPAALLAEHARAHLRSEAKLLKLDARLIDEARVFDAQFNGDGPAVVRFRQRVNGLEVFHRALNVMLDRSYRPVAVSGYFATQFDRSRSPAFALGAADAIAGAWTHLGGALDASALTLAETRGDWQRFDAPVLVGSHVFERAPRARPVWYPRANGLEPAYHVELFANARVNGQLIAYSFVVSAVDGGILHRKNLKADAAYSYRVFADTKGPVYQPFDSPLGNGYTPFPAANPSARLGRKGASSRLITLAHAGIKTGDPWLAAGATVTIGNNVEACLDAVDTPVSGIISNPANTCEEALGDLHPPVTGANSFDYPIVADEDPSHENAKAAAVVNLFYMVNWLHDWWYNHGFNEAAGNAQTDNYGRGGEDGDALLAQGQDASGRNNANMATPSDGSSPTMQQYLFDGPPIGEVRVTAPYDSGALTWVPLHDVGPDTYDLAGAVAMTDDGMGVSPSDGCGESIPNPAAAPIPGAPAAAPQPALAGKIALVDRGTCNFTAKVQFAMASGAVGVVIVNNADGDPPSSVGNGDIPVAASPIQPTSVVYTLPTVLIRKDDGARIKAALAAGEVTMHLTRSPSIDLDGTFDNQIIAHEFFHYVHHRLTDSSSQQTGAMSEGWGDISGFMLSVRPEDTLVPGNDAWQGAYGLAGYVANNFWSGIRRAPYTTDFSKNAFTFKHIAEGEPTPTGAPGTGNSEVHSAGEIWANMVYECYAGILNSRGAFGDAQSRMKDYIINGFKMTPADATYTEGRNAILAAALATDFDDFAACSAGFARRGAGLHAQAPARNSADLTGVVEDYTPFVCGGSVIPGREGEFGEGSSPVVGGALGLWLLAPLFGIAALRRRRRMH